MNMKKLLIATKNQGKFNQITRFLEGLDFDFVFLKDLQIEDEDFLEDGETFEENSFKKAAYYADKTTYEYIIGEDSGVYIDTFPGELGVFTRRWGAGEHASDQEWLDYFMEKMEGKTNRDARFVTNTCLLINKKPSHFEGATSGIITEKIMAPIEKGIPLSSCFLAEGMDRVYAALSTEEKLKISHRGKAMKQMREFLKNLKITSLS